MPIERETIVTTGPSAGTLIISIVVALVAVAVLLWAFGIINFNGASLPQTVDIDVPAVTITPDNQ